MPRRKLPDELHRQLRAVRDSIQTILDTPPLEITLGDGGGDAMLGGVADDTDMADEYPDWFLVFDTVGNCVTFPHEEMTALLAALVEYARRRDIPFTLPG